MLNSLSFRRIPKFMVSDEEALIKAETSIMLFTSLLSIDLIISPDFTPEINAGLSGCTSCICAGVKSFPANI